MSEAVDTMTTGKGDRSDHLIDKVVGHIRTLADGNGAMAADVVSETLKREDHPVWAGLAVTVGWESKKDSSTGYQRPAGSVYHDTFAGLEAAMQREVGAECCAPTTLQRLIQGFGDSLNALATLEGGTATSFSQRHYYHENCNTCGGTAIEPCPVWACGGGQVPCLSCGQTGHRSCYSCGGSGTATNNGYTVRCGACGGSGHYGNCYTCFGTGRHNCYTCGGSSRIGCRSCDATGGFTFTYRPYLTLVVRRWTSFSTGSPPPEALKSGLESIGLTNLHPNHVVLMHQDTTTDGDTIRMRFRGNAALVTGRLRCKSTVIDVDAVGLAYQFVSLPKFLDALVSDTVQCLCAAKDNPATAFAEANKTRVTKHILAKVGASSSPKTAEIATAFGNAVSIACVDRVAKALRIAYDGAGTQAVRRTWLIGAPLLLILCLAFVFYDTLGLLARATGADIAQNNAPVIRMGWILGVPTVMAMLLPLVAGRAGRRRVRALLGTVASRPPSQGMLPWTVLPSIALIYTVLTLAAFGRFDTPRSPDQAPEAVWSAVLAAWTPLSQLSSTQTASSGPYAGAAKPESKAGNSKTPLMTDLSGGGKPAAAAPETGRKNGTIGADPQGKERLMAIQKGLADLSLYKGAIDGVAGPSTDNALERMSRVIDPKDKNRFGDGLYAHTMAVRDDRIKLVLPVLDQSLVSSDWRNATRLRLTDDDQIRIVSAFVAAARQQPQNAEASWQTNEHHRGTISIKGETADPQERGRTCLRFTHEILTEAGRDFGKPQVACKQGNGWVLPR